MCVRVCGWLGVGKIKSWYLCACFILVSFWCFYCVRVAVFSSLFVISLLAIVRGVSALCGCATASSVFTVHM